MMNIGRHYGAVMLRQHLHFPNCRAATQARFSSARSTAGPRMASAPRPPRGGGQPPYLWMTAAGTTGMVGFLYFHYLEEVPLTHRKRWIITSAEYEGRLGDEEYKKLLAHFQSQGLVLPPDHRASITVRRVGSHIAKAAAKFAQEHKMAHVSLAPYTYTVVRSDMANAFVLPNNHVFVMTDMFQYVKNEDDLASVLGHETAHNLARHAGERMSSSSVMNFLGMLTLLFDPTGATFKILVPAAALFRELPHSRTQETEADRIGVFLAAEACYDPRAARRVFAAMKQGLDNHATPPEFLSTHPSHEHRLSNFDKWLPDAMKVYRGQDNNELSFGPDRCHEVRSKMDMDRKQAAQQAALREQSKR